MVSDKPSTNKAPRNHLLIISCYNMQRQAIPLFRFEKCTAETGLERQAAIYLEGVRGEALIPIPTLLRSLAAVNRTVSISTFYLQKGTI